MLLYNYLYSYSNKVTFACNLLSRSFISVLTKAKAGVNYGKKKLMNRSIKNFERKTGNFTNPRFL